MKKTGYNVSAVFVMKNKIGEEHRPKTYTTTQNAAIGSFSKKIKKRSRDSKTILALNNRKGIK